MKEPSFYLVYLIQPMFKGKSLKGYIAAMFLFSLAMIAAFDDKSTFLESHRNVVIAFVCVFLVLLIWGIIIMVFEEKFSIFQVEIYVVVLGLNACISCLVASYIEYYFLTNNEYIGQYNYFYITQVIFWAVYFILKAIIIRAINKDINDPAEQETLLRNIIKASERNNRVKYFLIGVIIGVIVIALGYYGVNMMIQRYYIGYEEEIKTSIFFFVVSLGLQYFGLHGISKLFYMRKYKEYVDEASDDPMEALAKVYVIIDNVKKSKHFI